MAILRFCLALSNADAISASIRLVCGHPRHRGLEPYHIGRRYSEVDFDAVKQVLTLGWLRKCDAAHHNQHYFSPRESISIELPIIPEFRSILRTFFGETESAVATRDTFRSDLNQTFGITISANSSVTC